MLQVLRRYACLWSMHKPAHERPKLIVVNLMWTPKDDLATLKINGIFFNDFFIQKYWNNKRKGGEL